MGSFDYFVGFEKEPENLDEFLNGCGYDRIPEEIEGTDRNYEPREGGLVELTYFSKSLDVKEGEVPDWKKAGFKVTSELMISTKDLDVAEEASRLAREIIRKFNGVLYDSTSGDYLRAENL